METYYCMVLLIISTVAQDNEDPVITCPSGITQPTDPGKNFATVNWSAPQVTDNVDSNLQATCDPASGGPVETGGPLTVTCEATDTAGNKGSCTFTINIEDTEPPVLNCPESVPLNTDEGKDVATYNVQVTATDNVDGALDNECMPDTGTFDLGDTTVTCTGRDNNNNENNCSFIVTVSDDEPPTFTSCMNQIFNELLNEQNKVVVNYITPTVTDNVGIVSAPDCFPKNGTEFDKGFTLVTCNASDAAGNFNQCSFNVTLINCELGTFGPTCVNCTCVDNAECEATNGNCRDCPDKDFGFVCNYADLAIDITANGLSVLDDVVTQHRGQVVELECIYNLRNIDGYWSRNEKVIDFTGDNTGTATYTISSVDFDDTGSTYTCTVNPLKYTNRIPSVSKSVTVNIEVPAEFVTRPQSQQGKLQDNLTFTCSAMGNPKVEITWINNNGNPIGMMESKYDISERETEGSMIFTTVSTLVVNSISRSDNGEYKCQVSNNLVNEVDVLVYDFEITVHEKPDPVIINKEASQATAKATEITVEWTRGIERNSEIQNCTVQYKEQCENVFDSVEAENDESHKLVGLMPFTDYNIEVFCTNTIGGSDKDEVILKTAEAGEAVSSVIGYQIAIVILCVAILSMSPPFIFFCRFYYSQKNKNMQHSTIINMTDYDDVKFPEKTRRNDTEYENTLPTVGSQVGGGSGDAARDAAAPPKVESHKDDSAYEQPHTYMTVESAYTNLKK